MEDQNSTIAESIFSPQEVSKASIRVIEDRKANPNAGITTGISPLDAVLNKHRPGELRIVLGYTSNYKSGLMNYIARHNAQIIKENGEADKKVVITYIWEQSVEEQGIIDISQVAMIEATKMMQGQLTDSEWHKIKEAGVTRGTLPWCLVGHSSESKKRRPRLSMTDVYDSLAHIVDVQKKEPALVVLDYLQRIQREEGRTLREQFMNIVDKAKDLAIAFHCPVILGSQAGRQVKSRQWQLPQVEDGQETSNLEQSADSFLSVWMPKTSYPDQHKLNYGTETYTVDNNLLILGVLKQKFGIAPKIIPLHVKPEVNEIHERRNP